MLNVWHDSQWVVIHLSAGDGAIFREDVWHGGASYDRQHGRVHKYWEQGPRSNVGTVLEHSVPTALQRGVRTF